MDSMVLVTPKRAEQPADQIAGRIVGFDETQHMIALTGQCQQRLGDRPDTGSGDQAVIAALHPGQLQFQLTGRRIRGARIEESRPVAAQKLEGVIQRLEIKLHGLIDGHHQRPIARRQRHFRRMIDTRGFLHSFPVSACGVAGEFKQPGHRLLRVASRFATHSRTNGMGGGAT